MGLRPTAFEAAAYAISPLRQEFFRLTSVILYSKIAKVNRYNLRGCSSAGRALAWHARGQEFNPPQLHLNFSDKEKFKWHSSER